jgi:hypothetical protein
VDPKAKYHQQLEGSLPQLPLQQKHFHQQPTQNKRIEIGTPEKVRGP